MKKVILFILILVSARVLPQEGKPLDHLTGRDWLQWSEERKLSFIQGYILGELALGIVLQKSNISKTEWKKFLILDFDLTVVKEVDRFYLTRTSRIETPLYQVVLFRKELIHGEGTEDQSPYRPLPPPPPSGGGTRLQRPDARSQVLWNRAFEDPGTYEDHSSSNGLRLDSETGLPWGGTDS
jgi:hypothetical protein